MLAIDFKVIRAELLERLDDLKLHHVLDPCAGLLSESLPRRDLNLDRVSDVHRIEVEVDKAPVCIDAREGRPVRAIEGKRQHQTSEQWERCGVREQVSSKELARPGVLLVHARLEPTCEVARAFF